MGNLHVSHLLDQRLFTVATEDAPQAAARPPAQTLVPLTVPESPHAA
jgi:hypothetical protein